MNPDFTQTPPGHSMTVLLAPYRRIAIITPKMEPSIRAAQGWNPPTTQDRSRRGSRQFPLLGERERVRASVPLSHSALRSSNSPLRDAGNQPLTPIHPHPNSGVAPASRGFDSASRQIVPPSTINSTPAKGLATEGQPSIFLKRPTPNIFPPADAGNQPLTPDHPVVGSSRCDDRFPMPSFASFASFREKHSLFWKRPKAARRAPFRAPHSAFRTFFKPHYAGIRGNIRD